MKAETSIRVKELSPFPPGSNPFNHDSLRVGTNIHGSQGKHYTIMWCSEAAELVIVDCETGRRLSVVMDEEYNRSLGHMFKVSDARLNTYDKVGSKYCYRGLPCSEAKWSVCGIHNKSDGRAIGILEWCYDEQDANEIKAKMEMDPAFESLEVCPPQDY